MININKIKIHNIKVTNMITRSKIYLCENISKLFYHLYNNNLQFTRANLFINEYLEKIHLCTKISRLVMLQLKIKLSLSSRL